MTPMVWGRGRYLLRRDLLSIVSAQCRIYDGARNLVLRSYQNGIKLKENIGLYLDDARTQEVARIVARQIIDFAATYDVIDSQSNTKIGALRRKGMRSILRDEWSVLDPHDREIATVIEDTTALAFFRRFVSNIVPQSYDMLLADGSKVADFTQNWNPFIYMLRMDFTMDRSGAIDERLKMAAAVLLAAIERRQGS